MAQSLSEQINRYFNLMESIREKMFRVIEVSDRYFGIVSFNTNMQAIQTSLVSKATLMDVKLLEGVTGDELLTFGTMVQAVERWVSGGMQGEFPIAQTQDVYAQYRALTSSPEKPTERPQTKGSDADKRDAQDLDNIKCELLTFDTQELIEYASQLKLGSRTSLRKKTQDELLHMMFGHYGLYKEHDQYKTESIGDWLKRIPLDIALDEVHKITQSSILIGLCTEFDINEGVSYATTKARLKMYLKEYHAKH